MPGNQASRSPAGDLRSLRKQYLVARSRLLREQLIQELDRSMTPGRLLRDAVALGVASPGRIAWVVLPWLLGRWRRRRARR